MSRLQTLAACLLTAALGGAVLWAGAAPPPPSPRSALWKEVDDAVNEGKPKTAIEKLGPIIEQATKDKAYPEVVRAVAKRIALEGTIQGNKPEEKIARLKAEMAKAPKEILPVYDALLGHWYWHYFQQHRYQFVNRSATAAAPGTDFTTWDLPRLFREIDAQYAKAMAADKELKAVPVAAWDGLLEKGTLPDAYRPTLYDFLAFEAVQFYSSGEQAAAKPEDAFEITAGSPALGTVEQFLAWKPDTTDADSPGLKALKLYQNLIAFHKDDADKSAFLDADLHRLQFAHGVAVGEEKHARYLAALKAFAETYADHELSAAARHHWAVQVKAKNDFVGARTIALQGANAFPKSVGGRHCRNFVNEIEAKQLQVLSERAWADPWPQIQIKYANITKLHFRAVKVDWVNRLGTPHWRPENITEADHTSLRTAPAAATWAVDLPATPDYHQATVTVTPPRDLTPGFYFVVASPDAAFKADNNPVSAAEFWVTDLAMVMRQEWGSGKIGGLVTKAESGEPVAGATVKTWNRDNTGKAVPGPTGTTDANGLFRMDLDTNSGRNWLVLVEKDGMQLASQSDHWAYRNMNRGVPTAQTIFFTDRSLYRPGQTVQFKGIVLRANWEKDTYEVLPNHPVTVQFDDPNRKEIAKLTLVSNAFGSVSGSFTAPRDRLTGRMQLRTLGDAPGVAAVSVEEYKRPKFFAELEVPKEAVKLNAAVTVTGKAVGYTGVPASGGKVKYRVTREVRWPSWYYGYYFWRQPVQQGAQEIAHGSTTTDADGKFAVTFPAKPDLSVPEKDEPTFHYTVTADVTDTTGETRSASKSVTVGYTALAATVTTEGWLDAAKPVKLTVTTTSHDGDGRAAKGTVKIIKLKSPDKVQRPSLFGATTRRGVYDAKPDPSDPRAWDDGETVAALPFTTDGTGKVALETKLPAGFYRAAVDTADAFGKPVTARAVVRVLEPAAAKFPLKVPNLLAAPKWKVEPGETFTAVWGTGYDAGRAFVEVEHRGVVVQSFWTKPGETQVTLTVPVEEKHRGGFQVRTTFVRENRFYPEAWHVDVPWSNKDLTVKWGRFTSKLEPGAKETFTATVTGPDAAKAAAEMVAGLYDASLDAFKVHDFLHKFNVFRRDSSRLNSTFENTAKHLQPFTAGWERQYEYPNATYRQFPADLTANLWGYRYGRGGRGGGPGGSDGMPGAPAPMSAAQGDVAGQGLMMEKAAEGGEGLAFRKAATMLGAGVKPGEPGQAPGPRPEDVKTRANLAETAFFFPLLTAGPDGSVTMTFTMPEAVTKWKFLGFAHDAALRSGYITADVVTAKELMAQLNPPRFLREGDVLEFTTKIANQSATRQVGSAKLLLTDARSNQSVDAAFGLAAAALAFELAAGESKTLSWKLTVPDGAGPVIYKAVAASDRLSDGEEGVLPVLSNRVLVTESLPLPMRGPGEKTFDFAKLRESGKSDTLRTQGLTVQMTSQPAWYAVLALPYLMEFPHECSEQIFSRLYANSLAKHIAGSDPKIRRVFDQWKNTPALDSPLVKNQDLKAATIEETPWLRDAVKEGEARRNVGVLFDENRLADETARGLQKLAQMQNPSGLFPWFPGGTDNQYISLYIATGFGRLRHLGVKIDVAVALKTLTKLDAWMDDVYREILRTPGDPEAPHIGPTHALYLYGRSFFLKDKPIAKEHAEANAYWLRQARKHWLTVANRQSQAHMALGLKRFGDAATPKKIMASIKERSVFNDELGLFWRDTELGWWWYHAPIETQAVMIEAFDEVMNDIKAVEDAKVWLLKQKQTQNWRTTKATADAVYALLLRGDNLLKSDALVTVKLGGEAVKPENVEAGTGFYEQKLVRGEVKPAMGTVTVTKTDVGVSWGSVHWQYLEDVRKVTPHEGTPLKLEKKLYKRTFTKTGPVIEEVKGPVAVGDELVTRVVLRTDRDMEYVHLKDHRGSGTEPVNVLSKYRFQDGLAYYESTKDTASHFFIDYLPKGTYVFEYAVRVQHRGTYPSGLASIQCMYAPEFNSHSGSVQIEVK